MRGPALIGVGIIAASLWQLGDDSTLATVMACVIVVVFGAVGCVVAWMDAS